MSIKIRLGLATLGTLVLLLALTAPASADPPVSWYADPSGDDHPGCGAAADPCLTIGYAISEANTGTLVIANAGTYTENITITKAISLTGAGPDLTIIHPAVSDVGLPDPNLGPSFRGSQVIVVEAHDVTIQELTIDGDNPTLTSGYLIHGADVDARNGIITNMTLDSWDNLHVHNTIVRNVYLRGLYASSNSSEPGASTGVEFVGNTIHNVDGNAGNSVGLMLWGAHGVISDNLAYDAANGVMFHWYSGGTIANNQVYGAQNTGIATNSNAEAPGQATQVYGNHVHDNTGMGMQALWNAHAPVEIYHNTILSNTWGMGIYGDDADGPYDHDIHHNLIQGSGANQGIWIENYSMPGVSVNLHHNTISHFDTGVLFYWDAGDPIPSFVSNTVQSNRITGNDTGILVYTGTHQTVVTGTAVHANVLCDNASSNVWNGTPTPLDGSGNWWGHNPPIVSGVDYSGTVGVSPPISFSLSTQPAVVDPAGGDTVTATVVYSDGMAHTAPDGLVVTWTVQGGTPAALTSTVSGGAADLLLTDDAIAGLVVTATDCCGFSQPATVLQGNVENLNTGEWFVTIQAAIDDADTLDGHTLLAHSGTYTENVVVDKAITLSGDGMGHTIIYPAFSDVGTPGAPSFQASQVIVVESDDVTIEHLTIDGNNPTISSGVTVNGVDIDARNGIIQNYNTGAWDSLVVRHVAVLNCYLRGIYAVPPSGQSLTGIAFHDNAVENVAGLHDHSVGVMARGSLEAILQNNTVVDTMRAVGCFAGSSCLIQGNTISNAVDSGLYISWNLDQYYTITGTTWVTDNLVVAGGMGMEIYYHDVPLTITHNTVSGAIVGVDVGGRTSDLLVADNWIHGSGVPTATGIIVETWGHGDTDHETAASLRGNQIYHTDYGVALLSDSGLTVTAWLENNLISHTLSSGLLITGPGSLEVTLGDSLAGANTFRASQGYAIQLIDATDDVPARFNDWQATDLAQIEALIHHQVDDPALGWVNYYGLTATAAPTSLPADGSSYAVVTGTLTGLLAPAGNVVGFSTNLGNLSAITATADPAGNASVELRSTAVGTATITATAGATAWTTATVEFIANPLDHFVLAPVADQIVGLDFGITVTAADAAGDVVTGYNGWADLSDASGSVAPTILGPFVDGVWTGPISVTTVWTDDVLTAAHPISPAILGNSNPFTVGYGSAVNISLTPDSATITAGQSIAYSVWATDTYGNGWDATAQAAYQVEPGAGGSWTGNVYTSQVAGTWAVSATLDAVSDQASLAVDVGPVASLDLSPDPATITAGQSIAYSLWAEDAYGNGWDATAQAAYQVEPGAGGSWTDNVYTSQVAGTWTVSATLDAASDQASLTVDVGPAASLDLSPDSATITAGQSISYSVWATDTYGNGWDATAQAAYQVEPGAGGSWAGNVYTSQVAGTWTVSATVQGLSGTVQLYDVTDTASLTVLPTGPGEPTDLTLVANPTGLPLDGTAWLTATVRDAQTQPLPGVVVSFGTADPLGSGGIDPITATTDAAGQAFSSLSSSLAGLKTITAQADDLTATAQVTFTAEVTAARIELNVRPTSLIANSGATATVTATLYDAADHPLPDQAISFSLDDPSLGTVGPDGTSDESGQAVATWTAGTVPQAGLITASSGDLSANAPVSLTVGLPDRFGFAPISTQTAGAPFSITLTTYDAYANVVTGFVGPAALTDTTGTISPTFTGPFVDGVWSGSVEIGQALNGVVITATSETITGASAPFDVTAEAEPVYRIYLPLVIKGN